MSTENLIKMANQIAQYFASAAGPGAGSAGCAQSPADVLGAEHAQGIATYL